jgi:hypothetical protein
MTRTHLNEWLVMMLLWMAAGTNACSGSSASGDASGSGGTGEGGASTTGGQPGNGGTHPAGGMSTGGGSKANGGTSSLGGSKAGGGTVATGGTKANGGTVATGGNFNTGGASSAAGCPQLPPNNGASCGSSALSCFYDSCPNGGRQLATCTNGTWNVQSGTSCTVICSSFVTTTTCSSGSVCVIRSGGAIMATCQPFNCGNGPITPECVGAAGCTMSASLANGATFTCPNSCPPGSGGCA